MQALAPQRRVIAWNAPGYWLSDNLVTRTPTAADYAQAVADFLDALGLARVVLYGHSFGSAVAQAFAIAHPQRVSHLVLSGTGVGQKQLSEQRRQAFEARAQRVQQALTMPQPWSCRRSCSKAARTASTRAKTTATCCCRIWPMAGWRSCLVWATCLKWRCLRWWSAWCGAF